MREWRVVKLIKSLRTSGASQSWTCRDLVHNHDNHLEQRYLSLNTQADFNTCIFSTHTERFQSPLSDRLHETCLPKFSSAHASRAGSRFASLHGMPEAEDKVLRDSRCQGVPSLRAPGSSMFSRNSWSAAREHMRVHDSMA
jgi:hypothetical protein